MLVTDIGSELAIALALEGSFPKSKACRCWSIFFETTVFTLFQTGIVLKKLDGNFRRPACGSRSHRRRFRSFSGGEVRQFEKPDGI